MAINDPIVSADLPGTRFATASLPNTQRTASATPGASAGETQMLQGEPSVVVPQNQLGLDMANIVDAGGRRTRLRPKPGAQAQIYGPDNAIQALILTKTKGMVWPYQPTITYSQEVDYQSMDLVHTNQEILSYQRTKAIKFTVDGVFTVQSNNEGLYALACIRFLQTVTKMYFGGTDGSSSSGLQGTPPPVLLFDSLGQYMFNCLPVVVNSFTVGLPNDCDYVPVNTKELGIIPDTGLNSVPNQVSRVTQQSLKQSTDIAWLPAIFNIQVVMTVQNTPKKLRQFDLDRFRTGELIRNGGWI